MKTFDQLTMRGRARRLRRVARKALDAYDIDVKRMRLVNNISNCTFRVDATGGRSYALRINLPGMRSIEEVRSELLWQEAICRDTDIAAPAPARTRTGDLVIIAAAEGVPEPRICNVSSWVRGIQFSLSKTPDNFRRLGILMAKLHDHGASFTPPSGFSVPKLDTPLSPELPDLIFNDNPDFEILPGALALMIEIRAALDAELQRLYRAGNPHVIHGDLHLWNVLVDRRTLHPIDFEDCALGFPIQDIAITFYYLMRDERFADFLSAYRSGYETLRTWPEEYPGQFNLLLGQRALELVNLLLNSTFQEDRAIIPEYIDIVVSAYRQHFERWRSLN